MQIKQLLLDTGINAFGLDLVCESILKSPAALEIAKGMGGALEFEYPIQRGDCPDHLGVKVRFQPIPLGGIPASKESAFDALLAYADFEERYDQHFENVREGKVSEIAFWESVTRLMPEVAALCPEATQADAADWLDLPDEQPTTPEQWAELRSRMHDSGFNDGDEGNFAQALFKFGRDVRREALAQARGELAPTPTNTSEEAPHAV